MMQKNSAYIALVFELIVLVVCFLYIGQWFDEKYSLSGLGTFSGAFLSLTLWIYHLVLVAKRLDRQDGGDRTSEVAKFDVSKEAEGHQKEDHTL